MNQKIVLIDGHSIINRAFYGVPPLTNSQGLHTNGIYGFLNILFKILEEEQPDYLTVAFDRKAPTFRHEMYEAYKGTRKPMPRELHEQVPVLKDVLHAMGICTVEQDGLEADDILGTIARLCEGQDMTVSLVSGDRDLLQIASEKTCIRIPKTRKGKTEIENYHTREVVELYGVTPEEFIDMKALMGDASDNIPGVPGIGEKTASALISRFHSIENMKSHIEEITPARARNAFASNLELADLSRKLAKIKTDCELNYTLEHAKFENPFTSEAYDWIKRLEFKSMLSRFSTEEILSQEVNEQHQKECLIQEEDALLELEQSLAQESVVSFILWHDGQDVCESRQILYLGILAGDTVYTAHQPDWIDRMTALLIKSPVRKVTVNLKRQLAALYAAGDVSQQQYEDAGIMAYLLNPLKDSYDYDDLARDYLDRMVASRKDILGKITIQEALMGSEEALGQMTALCCQSILEAFPVLLEKLEQEGMKKLYEQVEMPLCFTLYSMQYHGIRADRKALQAYGHKLAQMEEKLEQEIYDLAGEHFNINSPKQLGTILFEKMKLPAAKKTKTGYSTAADVLEKLRPDYPIVDRVLEYRQIAKLKSTYADGLDGFIKEDGRIHGNFHQTITATGRISSTEPNLQNIPIRMELGREIRKIFIPQDGFVFVDADYSQIELRVLAHMSKDERLINAYNQAEDIHAITASQVFHVPLSEVTPQLRRNAKAVNFGIVYGISAFGLSEDLSITRKEAQEYMEQYFKTYPSIKEFLDGLVEQAKNEGLTRTMFGRIRPVPELKSGNFMQRQFGERIAMNAPIQGTAADIIKIAMVAVDRRLKAESKKSRLILQIHDELLVEAAEEEAEQVKQILKEEMTQAAKLSVALEIDMHTGKSWYDTK